MSAPRKHHSVPQSLLRQFAAPGRREQVFVYDKERRTAFPSSIKDAAAERDFYSLDTGSSHLNFESVFQQVDHRLAEVLHALNHCDGREQIDDTFRQDIPFLVATQLLRTQLQRTSATDLAAKLNATGEPLGVEPIDLSETDVRRIHLQRLLGIEHVVAALNSKDILFFRAAHPERMLWVSDNPVVLYNSSPYGRLGVAAPGIELYFPISCTRCLALYCPSIVEQIRESLDPHHPRPSSSSSLFPELVSGVDRGTWVPIDADVVTFLNELQIHQSSRFLYSAFSDFSQADRVLDKHPSAGKVASLLELGELGTISTPFPDMPLGTFLLLERGHRHDLLAVVDRSDGSDGGNIVVQVVDSARLAMLDQATPFSSATLITDRRAVQYMREVVLRNEMEGNEQVLVIRHADPSLQALMDAINSRRSAP